MLQHPDTGRGNKPMRNGATMGRLLIPTLILASGSAAAADRWVPDENTCGLQPNTVAVTDCLMP